MIESGVILMEEWRALAEASRARLLAAASREELTSESLHHALGELAGTERRSALLHFLDESIPEELDELRAALAQLEARSIGTQPPARRPRAGHLRRGPT